MYRGEDYLDRPETETTAAEHSRATRQQLEPVAVTRELTDQSGGGSIPLCSVESEVSIEVSDGEL